MVSEVEKLQRALKEAQQRVEDERRGREEAQQRAENERHGREEAEKYLRGTVLLEFLQHCHDLCIAIDVVTDKSLTTQGDVTDPTNRLYPKKILPWTEFAADQAEVWEAIGEQTPFAINRHFASRSDFAYERRRLGPVSSEISLRRSETLTVENMVSDLFKRATEDAETRRALGLSGSMMFQDHTNLGDAGNAELSESMRNLKEQQNNKRANRQQSPYRHRGNGDQFPVLKSDEDGSRRPIGAIEYKAPHKLSVHTVSTGLKAPIDTHEDIISKREEPVDEAERDRWWCQYVMAAVITQLFSYMVAQGIRYGYISTGQAYVFLRIGEDPQNVYYSVYIPSLDFRENDEFRLYRTTVARVFAFIVIAAREAGPGQTWQQQAHLLSPWKFDLHEVFYQMPVSIRTSISCSEYIPDRSSFSRRSPIRTRSFCRTNQGTPELHETDSSSDGEDRRLPASPLEQRRLRSGRASTSARRRSTRLSDRDRSGRTQRSGATRETTDRAYCSHSCLRGITQRSEVDIQCPNAISHGQQHPGHAEFLAEVRQQLAKDIDACCWPLHMHGARGGLLRICLEPSGYTFVAKGTQRHDLKHMLTERETYQRLLAIQGHHIPVCLGMTTLDNVYYHSGARLSHLLLMSWGGYTLSAPAVQSYRHLFRFLAENALAAVHQIGISHNDAESRNILFNPRDRKLMLIDFERAQILKQEVSSTLRADLRSNVSMQGVSRGYGSIVERDMATMQRCLGHS